MDAIVSALGVALGVVMRLCYQLVGNYGVAIIVFTLFTKLCLLPLSIWLHRNGIKIIRLEATINDIKADYYGDSGTIADKQAALYKREKYNPLANLIPLAVQIVLLMGLVEVIYHPFQYILALPEDAIAALAGAAATITGADAQSSSIQLAILDALRETPGLSASFAAALPVGEGAATLSRILSLNTDFLGVNITLVPSQHVGWLVLVPVAAAASSWLLCYFQNHHNVLQSEQGFVNKYGTMILSVGLSLYLGWFVPAGIALYWIVSNLYAIGQNMLLNRVISPRKYVDYDHLERSRERLRQIEALQTKDRSKASKDDQRREKADYKRFFSVANKHLVFYSEKSGYYKFFKDIIEYLLAHSNVVIHYVTNDPNDITRELSKTEPRIRSYYIGKKRSITLMMKMDADIVVMTTPELDDLYLKRSYVRQDIEYIYTPHGMGSTNIVVHKGAYDHFDTVFCVGAHQEAELRESEQMYGTPRKNLVHAGYALLDHMVRDYADMPKERDAKTRVLIAPSWQEGNLLDACLDDMLASLAGRGYDVRVRPHPEYVKRFPAKWQSVVDRVTPLADAGVTLDTDFLQTDTVLRADVIITDWSTIAHEFAYVTLKPALFIDTPMKVLNEDYVKYQNQPIDITLRNEVGMSLAPEDAGRTGDCVRDMLARGEDYRQRILDARTRYVYQIGDTGGICGRYILGRLVAKGGEKR